MGTRAIDVYGILVFGVSALDARLRHLLSSLELFNSAVRTEASQVHR